MSWDEGIAHHGRSRGLEGAQVVSAASFAPVTHWKGLVSSPVHESWLGLYQPFCPKRPQALGGLWERVSVTTSLAVGLSVMRNSQNHSHHHLWSVELPSVVLEGN